MAQINADYVKECEKEKRICVRWISAKEQIADILTKPLDYPLFSYFRNQILNSN